MGCRFIGGEAAAPGSCTNFAGVLSNREIRRTIKDDGIQPYLNETAMVEYFKYKGDSWVGYDDAETYAMKEAYVNDRCLSIEFDDETGGGIGLDTPNNYKSPESASIIPIAHTTVPSGQTFTLGPGASTDVPRLPNGGNQNSPIGPGAEKCSQCSFFRLITSTCCGTGGSIGNPFLIPAGVPVPMDIPLPAGFIPSQPFKDPSGNTISANQPLPQETIIPCGTGDDQNSTSPGLIWLSHDIWKEPNPQVQCYFQCTFVLPPWPSYTTTIDYPRITVTEDNTIKTTLTFPPLTISRWEPSNIVVSGRASCTTSCIDEQNNRRTSSVKISTTTIWAPVPYTTDGTIKTTRPPSTTDAGGGGRGGGKPPCPWPICPGPPPPLNLPSLTINVGPPKPTVTPCAYPAAPCTPPGTTPPPNPGETGFPDPDPTEPAQEEVNEEVDKEDLTCRALPSNSSEPGDGDATTSKKPDPTTTKQPDPTTSKQPDPTTKQSPPKKTPGFSKDEIKCYDSGQVARRGHVLTPVDAWCVANKGKTLKSKYYSGELRTAFPCCDTLHEVVPIEVKYSVEMKEGCKWKVDEATCKAEWRKVIDGCDRNTADRKQGGRLVGDCVTWRVDPNASS
ncbi:hypothetical protein EK21DRAFT_104790 [Setomelanomma holmii]|uniref:Uncharacterized protein n=1 Tax=Setomelanomma holmii TaxID=210430 RepID=A0A9P4GX16_9PLEO|nr:hypothetical protein EK21DRAFT_104790 [Setomelanomma holmii]